MTRNERRRMTPVTLRRGELRLVKDFVDKEVV